MFISEPPNSLLGVLAPSNIQTIQGDFGISYGTKAQISQETKAAPVSPLCHYVTSTTPFHSGHATQSPKYDKHNSE